MKPRGVIVAGNWKMNHGAGDTEKFFGSLSAGWNKVLGESTKSALKTGALKAMIFPPALSIHTALRAAAAMNGAVRIGAQNAHWEQKGAFTGELSGPMLKEAGISHVLVGHSERRQFFGETDETVRKRTESLLEQGITVIMCIGETKNERESNQTTAILDRQLTGALPEPGKGGAKFLDGRLVIAYEPVWAIGTGLTATPAQAEEAHKHIRQHLWDRFGMEASGRTPVLYGGSVTPENMGQLLDCPNIDGGLIGGASLKPDGFLAMLETAGKM